VWPDRQRTGDTAELALERTMTFYAPDGRPLRTAEVAPEEPVLGPNDRV
jgi:hypothetical protein